MYLRVLGPLSIGRDGSAQAAINASMLRRLLAALLCRANQYVSVDELLFALWGETAPPGARKTLQVYVRRLRGALDDAARITNNPAGYRISVDTHEFDAARFAELVAEAAAANDQRAASLLEGALGLWRGRAYEDVRDSNPMANEARRLDEEKLRVEAWFARLQLDAGRQAELVPHLTKLVEEHPYREDLRGHLMLALYRCGRQTEALEVFRTTRKMLNEELGVEPTPALQRLHEAILRGDAELDPAERSAVMVPRELPADIAAFVGRAEPLRMLDQTLSHSSPVIISAIAGSAGVGKSVLAVHWAHSVAGEFPDGQIYVNLGGFDPVRPPMPPEDAMRRLLDSLGVPPQRIPADMDAQATLYRSMLAGKRMLLVLDNARSADQVRPLLPGSPTTMVVLTSRNQLASLIATTGARSLNLDVLTIDEARELLATRIGEHRTAAEPDAVDEIIAHCSSLPLALAVVAANVATDPAKSLANVAAELRNEGTKLDAFRSPDDPMTDLRTVFSWSYDQLSAGAVRLFRQLGMHPGPDISTPAVVSLAGLPAQQILPLLAELTRGHLVWEHLPGRYRFHDLLRAYAVEQAERHDSPAERRAAIHRVLDHYWHTADAADRLLDPSRDRIPIGQPISGVAPEQLSDVADALAWLTAEHQILLALVRLAPEFGPDAQTWQLAWAMRTFLDRQGHWSSQVAVNQAALDAARQLGDVGMQAYAHRALGRLHARTRSSDAAHSHYRQAVELHRQAGDRIGQAQACRGLAWVLNMQGQHMEALDNTMLALELFRESGHRVGEANTLKEIGLSHAELGNLEQALDFCQRALIKLQELGDAIGEADAWDTIGDIHHELGRLDEACAAYRRAIELYRAHGDRVFQAESLKHLGDTLEAAGDRAAACDAWRQALAIFTDMGHPSAREVRSKLGAE